MGILDSLAARLRRRTPLASWHAPAHAAPLRRLAALLAIALFGSLATAQPPGGQPPTTAPTTPPAGAQDPVQPPKIRVEGNDVIFALDENVGLPFLEFVKFAQKFTGKRFFIDKKEPDLQTENEQNRILLYGTLKIPRDDFYAFFQTILFIKGWVCVPRGTGEGQFIDLISQQGPRSTDIRKGVLWVPPDELDKYANQTGTYIITTVQTKYVNAQLASNNLRTFWTDPRGLDQILPLGGTVDQRWLMIVGFGPSVYTIAQLIKVVDVPEAKPKAVLRSIPLENSGVEEVQTILDEIMGDKARQPAQPAAGGVIAPEDQIPVKILRNEANNQLIVYAHEDRVREIENYVAILDTKSARLDSNFHVYRLINQLAKDVHESLSQFIDQAITAQQQAQAGAGAPGGAGGSTRREQKPVIRFDEKSNSLLISASRSLYERIVDIIKSLDKRQDQVLIEAALIELGTEDVSRFGIELGLLDLGSGDFTRPFGITSFGLTTLEDSDGNGLPDTRLPDLENPLRGLTGGIISSDDFAIPVVINALKSNNESNVLSIPSVLVNDNEDAAVSSKLGFPTTRSQTGNVTTQTDFAGFEDAGIDLQISPSISEGNFVKLNINLEVSNFTGTFDSTQSLPPPKRTRKITTVVTVPSGDTMVFGGVIEDQTSDTGEGVPFLQDLPLIGVLFRSTEKVNRKTNLYFFLTPHILSDEDFADLADLTYKKKLEAARYIGNRRVKMIDSNWRADEGGKLDDTPATIEDIDRLGGFDIPTYERPKGGETQPATKPPGRGQPQTPGEQNEKKQ